MLTWSDEWKEWAAHVKISYESFEWVHVSGRHKQVSQAYYVVPLDCKRMDLKSLKKTFLVLMVYISNKPFQPSNW